MSANADVLQGSGLLGPAIQETAVPEPELLRQLNGWNPEEFAREQIRSLVRRVFFPSGARPVKQVVFSAAEAQTDVGMICDQVGRALASETRADIVIVRRDLPATDRAPAHGRGDVGHAAIRSWGTQTAKNLWRMPEVTLREKNEEAGTGRFWFSYLADLRSEFEYSVIQGPAAGISSEAALLGQLADGIILVLDAHNTRRAPARKIKEVLESSQTRILGTVLCERTFPVPESIYRRL
jgi:hypothetical protein